MSLPSAHHVAAQERADVDTSGHTGILPNAACMSQLDAAAEQLRRGATQAAEDQLLELLGACPDTPQIQHNLAVIEAQRDEWDEAMVLLLESIALDARASASLETVREIHRWRASEAYARALTGEKAAQPAPELAVQSSMDVNSDTLRNERQDASLFDNATVEYELWEWWRSATKPTSAQHRSHYSTDYNGENLLSPTVTENVPNWDAVSREIRFIGHDALALISWTTDDVKLLTNESRPFGHLLLMRVEDDRWRIYESLPLP